MKLCCSLGVCYRINLKLNYRVHVKLFYQIEVMDFFVCLSYVCDLTYKNQMTHEISQMGMTITDLPEGAINS